MRGADEAEKGYCVASWRAEKDVGPYRRELGAERVAAGLVGALLGMGEAWCGMRKSRG